MNQKRRTFLSYISILGIASFGSLTSLNALTFNASKDSVYVDHSQVHDDMFDPDGWL